jgi:hypothetical protein
MRQEIVNATCRVSWQAFKHVRQVAIRIVAVEFGGLDQAHDYGCTAPRTQRAGEQPVGSTQRHHAVILPISGVKLKFTIAGIRSMVDVHMLITASSARLAA